MLFEFHFVVDDFSFDYFRFRPTFGGERQNKKLERQLDQGRFDHASISIVNIILLTFLEAGSKKMDNLACFLTDKCAFGLELCLKIVYSRNK